MQVPSALHRANHVIAALHNDGWDFADSADILQKLTVGAEEAFVYKVVALDAREGNSVGVFPEFRDVVGIQAQVARRAFPNRPGSRGLT